MKKIRISVLLSLFLLVTVLSCSVINAKSTFTDVSSSNEFYDAIEYLGQQGVVKGYADGTYGPSKQINRAEFLKIVVEATVDDDEINSCAKSSYKFSDTPTDQWYSPYVCVGKKAGIVSGYSDGTYKPASSINFVEAAKIISNSYGMPSPGDSIWYRPFVKNLEGKAAIPTSISSFEEYITRGEMAEIIYRIKAQVIYKDYVTYEEIESGSTSQDSSDDSGDTGSDDDTGSVNSDGNAASSQDSALDYGFGAGLLPIGTDKITSTPKVGYIYSCNTHMNGGGATVMGPWLHLDEGYWDPSAKIYVDGDVKWSNANFSVKLSGEKRTFSGNGLPTDHNTGIYPVSSSDDAYYYDRNPNSIMTQVLSFYLMANPDYHSSAECVPGTVGIAVNGIPIFNGFDAGGRDAVAVEIQDECDGHPEKTGQYHYHNLSKCIDDSPTKGQHSDLVAYALDGFGIFGKYGENGGQLKTEDLDECHGHKHEINWDGATVEMYHYHMTDDFPYTVSCFRGDFDRDEVEDLL